MDEKLLDEALDAVKDARDSVENEIYNMADFCYSHAERLLQKIIEMLDYDLTRRKRIEMNLDKIQKEHSAIQRKLNKQKPTTTYKPLEDPPGVFDGYSEDKSIAKTDNDLNDDCDIVSQTLQSKPTTTNKSYSGTLPKKYAQIKRKYEPKSALDASLAEMIESEIRLKQIDENVTLKDVAGMRDVKQRLREAIEWPTLFPELCTGLRSPINGLLLFGPPGTGKTKIAKALANLSGLEFFNVQQSVIIAKEVGDSERMIRILFDMARYYEPSIIFFDEIDAIGGQRSKSTEAEASRRLKTELLVQMDGVSADKTKRVLVIGATNFPWGIDDALRRRLEKRILVPLPDYEARLDILKSLSKDTILSKKVRLEEIAEKLEGYSGSDIVNLYTSAAQGFLAKLTHTNAKVKTLDDVDRKTEKLLPQNFDIAFENIRQTVTIASQKKYEEWAKQYGSV